MLMKVFNKGQVVIPAKIRKVFGIRIGEMLDVVVHPRKKCIELKKSAGFKSHSLAGCLSAYKKDPFPTRRKLHEALQKGILNEKQAD